MKVDRATLSLGLITDKKEYLSVSFWELVLPTDSMGGDMILATTLISTLKPQASQLSQFPFDAAFSTFLSSPPSQPLNFPFVSAFSTFPSSPPSQPLNFPFVAAFSAFLSSPPSQPLPPTQQSPPFLLSSRRRAYLGVAAVPTQRLSVMSIEGSSIPLTINSVIAESNEVNLEINKEIATAGQETQENAAAKEEEGFQTKKRKKISEVWNDFDTVDGSKKAKCKHCQSLFTLGKSGATSSLLRHRLNCVKRKINLRAAEQQSKLSFLPTNSASPSILTVHSGKFDMEQMREVAAHWIMMHEHPFTILDEEGFNLMMRRGMPEWHKISRTTCRTDCMKIYEIEKKKLKKSLECVDKISLTTDCWKSKTQKIEYMVVTGHWIDSCWNLQKRVLSFINIPPPRGGLQISDAIFKCMKEWGIENKVFTITVDNASSNDLAIRYMKDTIQRSRTLACEGNLFHVRCCAHILNLCVQDGLREIEDIIGNIRESVEYVNRSEARCVQFAECVQQLQLKDKKLIRDYKTRWNSTFEMLSCALKFKEAFKMFKERDPFYGSEYPTSNLFLQEVQKIKSALDIYAQHEDLFLKQLASKMKEKFDKYWGDCNLLMAIAAVLDPTKKMLAVEFCFPKLYSELDASKHISKVKEIINSLYEEYVVEETNKGTPHLCESESFGSSSARRSLQNSVYNWDDFDDYCAKVEISETKRSELVDYLEKGRLKKNEIPKNFSCLEWWRMNRMQYPILSKIAADILAIPVSSVASEATFSAGTRVIDSYRSSLSPDTVQTLLCGGDWLRHIHGLKKKTKKAKTYQEIVLPIIAV
ncbi:zinc finger BED domain-containing protein RICESLEEPER 2-like [Zingiber officinale]|uniref:zinc finger BED domain-containing protein RICESLEEPER 2-like n=1 Tax=Zingiber officinale TaxID=94328 RepID=UPI001C4AD0AA|nr:zinc finger BED domain-containing protein RICESLEEPER 2-like [Zingiber officinale]